MNKKLIITKWGGVFLLLLAFSLNAFAQNITVRGSVTDVSGEPLIGVAIRVAGTSTGVITDMDGKYTLANVPPNATLEVSYVGMATQNVAVNSRATINIVMSEDTELLDEVVVVGYGTMQRRQITSSISSVRGDQLPRGIGGSTVATALQGRISGLIINSNASPNSDPRIQLRGAASIRAGQNPLIVIDGIPGGSLQSVNAEDIQSIDVLKDASAGAIYGTRAAAGVILITTRQAQEGPVRISYTVELATETVRRRPEMLNASEFMELFPSQQNHGANTDWYDLLVRDNPFSHRHVVTVSGGSRDARIRATFTAQDQQGIAIGDSRTDYSGRINNNFRFLDGFMELATRSEFRQRNRDGRISDQTFNMALRLNPTEPAFDANNPTGYNVITGAWEYYNPLADIMLRSDDRKNQWMQNDATLKFNLMPNLSAQTTIGQHRTQETRIRYIDANHEASVNNNRRGEALFNFAQHDRFVFDTQVDYNNSIGKHTFGAVVGSSFFEAKGEESFSMSNRDFPVNGVGPWNMGSGTELVAGRASMSSNKRPRERLLGFFGRANYSYDNRYMATASIRREGSSKFGPNNRWGTFWALSGGWRISSEAFMQNVDVIDDLRLRVGYGVTGNNEFDPGLSVPMFSSDEWWLINGKWDRAYGTARNVNPNLKWETNNELNIGVDFELLGNRLWGKFDTYRRYIDGLHQNIAVPVPPSVHNETMMNFGNMEAKGWEFEIGGELVRTRNLRYQTTARFSHNNVTITSLRGSGTYENRMGFPSPGHPGDAVRLQEGARIGQFFIWKGAGFDEQGRWLIYNKNNEVILAERVPGIEGSGRDIQDKRYIGNAIPDLIISWDHNISYKNWDASMMIRSWIGHDVYNMMDMYYGLPTADGWNKLRDAVRRNAHITGEKQLTDYFIEKGTFVKIDAINIGYNFNMKKLHPLLDTGRIYFTVRDLLTLTNYRGMNPEVDITGLEPGFERFQGDNAQRTIYPQTRRFTLGVQLNF